MDLKSTFGLHTIPFTREIPTDALLALASCEAARDGILRAIDKRMSAALIAPAGTGKTTVLRWITARLPEARYRVHYVRCTSIGKRDMCRCLRQYGASRLGRNAHSGNEGQRGKRWRCGDGGGQHRDGRHDGTRRQSGKHDSALNASPLARHRRSAAVDDYRFDDEHVAAITLRNEPLVPAVE
jgi:hypothetical protein